MPFHLAGSPHWPPPCSPYLHSHHPPTSSWHLLLKTFPRPFTTLKHTPPLQPTRPLRVWALLTSPAFTTVSLVHFNLWAFVPAVPSARNTLFCCSPCLEAVLWPAPWGNLCLSSRSQLRCPSLLPISPKSGLAYASFLLQSSVSPVAHGDWGLFICQALHCLVGTDFLGGERGMGTGGLQCQVKNLDLP